MDNLPPDQPNWQPPQYSPVQQAGSSTKRNCLIVALIAAVILVMGGIAVALLANWMNHLNEPKVARQKAKPCVELVKGLGAKKFCIDQWAETIDNNNEEFSEYFTITDSTKIEQRIASAARSKNLKLKPEKGDSGSWFSGSSADVGVLHQGESAIVSCKSDTPIGPPKGKAFILVTASN